MTSRSYNYNFHQLLEGLSTLYSEAWGKKIELSIEYASRSKRVESFQKVSLIWVAYYFHFLKRNKRSLVNRRETLGATLDPNFIWLNNAMGNLSLKHNKYCFLCTRWKAEGKEDIPSQSTFTFEEAVIAPIDYDTKSRSGNTSIYPRDPSICWSPF